MPNEGCRLDRLQEPRGARDIDHIPGSIWGWNSLCPTIFPWDISSYWTPPNADNWLLVMALPAALGFLTITNRSALHRITSNFLQVKFKDHYFFPYPSKNFLWPSVDHASSLTFCFKNIQYICMYLLHSLLSPLCLGVSSVPSLFTLFYYFFLFSSFMQMVTVAHSIGIFCPF